MSSFDFLTGPTGGWQYHLSALRHRKAKWTPFVKTVTQWLADWSPQEKELIIFGPSGGYSLPLDFLKKFERVIFVEPDPSARLLLRLRFAGVKAQFISDATILPWFNESQKWPEFLAAHPQAAILFSNLLGQIKLLAPKAPKKKDLDFLEALRNRTWASYHDLLSSADSLTSELPTSFDGNRGIEELAQKFFVDQARVTDHEALWLAQGRSMQTAIWNLRPRQSHVIGFIYNKA